MHLGALALVLLLLVHPLAAAAQQAPKVPRIGYLSVAAAEAEAEKSRVGAFQQGLRELGYVEGENILVEQRHAAGRVERLLELAAELVRLKVDVLVVSGSVHLVKNVTGTIPIVMPVHADPVGVGLVASLARPGGNITGLSDQHGATPGKRLQLLKEVVPSLSRVAVLWNPDRPITLPQLKSLQAAAPALGITLLSLQVRSADDLATAFGMIRKERSEGVLLIAEPTVSRLAPRIAEFAVKNRLPTIGTTRSFAEENGFLMAYGANFDDLWRRSATYVDKILKGAKPGDLPVELASKWYLVINLKTANALRLTIPRSLLLQADHVIE
jgi:putative ABC transport system substrate-binding protein